MKPILEKLQKLLALAKSSNVHEAALALEKAHALAQEHRIDLSQVSVDEATAQAAAATCHEVIDAPSRQAYEYTCVRIILKGYFNVHVFTIKRQPIMSDQIAFVGRAVDVSIALYLHDFLLRTMRAARKDWARAERKARRKVTGNKIKSFYTGFVIGLKGKLEKLHADRTAQERALVTSEDAARCNYIKDHFGELISKPVNTGNRHNQASAMRGIHAGKTTNLHSPVEGQTTQPLALQ